MAHVVSPDLIFTIGRISWDWITFSPLALDSEKKAASCQAVDASVASVVPTQRLLIYLSWAIITWRRQALPLVQFGQPCRLHACYVVALYSMPTE